MKSTLALAAVAAIVSISTIGVAHAQSPALGVSANTNINVGTEVNLKRNVNAQASSSASVGVQGNATSTAAKDNREASTQGNATSTSAKNKDTSGTVSTRSKITSETHRSTVATFVKSLLAVADRQGGIGPQVRVVAKSQNDSASTTAHAITKVEKRGFLRTFFFGQDHKNLTLIRGEIATTTANIARLNVLLTQTTSITDRAELALQIQALESELVKVEAYVKAREGKFSLLGSSKASTK
ncbi:MAG TPA: hypothetical protein VJH55_04020 [Candidatus Paceibacterota bacterium]